MLLNIKLSYFINQTGGKSVGLMVFSHIITSCISTGHTQSRDLVNISHLISWSQLVSHSG